MVFPLSKLAAVDAAIDALVAGETPTRIKTDSVELDLMQMSFSELVKYRRQIVEANQDGGCFNLVRFDGTY